MAVAHSILVMAYHMLQRKEPYREAGAKRLQKRLEELGYQVTLQKSTEPAIA